LSDTADSFRGRIDQMIDRRHPLAVLGSRMPWQEIEAGLASQFARRVREGKRVEGMDLFGPSTQRAGAGVSKAGRPRLPMRLMISLLYLKHAFDESDEGVVDRWSDTPLWQCFSGMDYDEHRRPCDPTVLVEFRTLLGEAGVEELLAQAINAAVNLKLIDRGQLSNVIVDPTVQPKAATYPTDSRLLESAREKLVEIARAQGIALKQAYAKEGAYLRHKAGRYGHARQFKRMRRVIRRQRTIVGRLQRQIQTRVTRLTSSIRETLGKANRVFAQTANRKAEAPKRYSWHAPEVVCMSKGKARTPYEFGAKVGIATTLRGSLIVGARAFDGNPYDGHTHVEQIEQATILMQDTGMKPGTAWVDLGYRGVDADNPDIEIKHRGKRARLTELEVKTLRRRQAIEPVIGHLKADHRMGRCHLKGRVGRQDACGVVRGGLQHPVAAADDSCERPASLLARAFLRVPGAMRETAVGDMQRLPVGVRLIWSRLAYLTPRRSHAPVAA
jgi:IS5 family transposase